MSKRGRKCSICTHLNAEQIDQNLRTVRKLSIKDVAVYWNVDYQMLAHHVRKGHSTDLSYEMLKMRYLAMRQKCMDILRDVSSMGREEYSEEEAELDWALATFHFDDIPEQEVLSSRRRELAKIHHPDQNPEINSMYMANINKAFSILKDNLDNL